MVCRGGADYMSTIVAYCMPTLEAMLGGANQADQADLVGFHWAETAAPNFELSET